MGVEDLETLSAEELHTPNSFLVLFNGDILGKHRKPQVTTMFDINIDAYTHIIPSQLVLLYVKYNIDACTHIIPSQLFNYVTSCDGMSCNKRLGNTVQLNKAELNGFYQCHGAIMGVLL